MSVWKSRQAAYSMKNFFTEKGQHGIIYGQTGSGKTTLELEFCKVFFNGQEETILWRDTGKNHEFAALGLIADLKIFCPEGCGVTLKNPLSNYELAPFTSYSDIFSELDRKKINVISERRFIRDPFHWTEFWSFFFRELVECAFGQKLPVPLSLFVDELNQLVPTRDKSLDKRQNYTAAMVAHNLENLRACKVRVVATSQGIKKILKAVRDCFPFKFFKRIDEDPSEESPALRKAVYMIQSLPRDSFVILSPSKRYTNPVRPIPNWKLGELSRKHQVEYWGSIPDDWVCYSEFRQTKKEKFKDALKALITDVYANGLRTNGDPYNLDVLAELTGLSKGTISNYANQKPP